MTDQKIILSIVVIAAVTAALRFLPFILFDGKKTPSWLEKLGSSLPYAVMGMLVVYCLRDISFSGMSGYAPYIISVLVVGISYLIKKNTLISIVLGTLSYMILIQFVFI